MTEQTALPLTTSTGLNGATKPDAKKARAKKRRFTRTNGRIDWDTERLELADAFESWSKFTCLDVQRYLGWPKTTANTLLTRSLEAKLIERVGTDGKRNYAYHVVKSEATQAGQTPVIAAPKERPAVPPLAGVENQLDALDALGVDTKKARLGLEKALEIKAQLEGLIK